MYRLMIVEDEQAIAQGIANSLQREETTVTRIINII